MGKAKKPVVKNPGRDSGEVTIIAPEISTPLKLALDRCAAETGRSKRFMIERALEAYLKAEGFWPPKD